MIGIAALYYFLINRIDEKTPFEKWVGAYDDKGATPGFLHFFTHHESVARVNTGSPLSRIGSVFNFDNMFRSRSTNNVFGGDMGSSPNVFGENPLAAPGRGGAISTPIASPPEATASVALNFDDFFESSIQFENNMIQRENQTSHV